ncbi:MAG: hypothetical protein UFG06_03450 [Lachnospiraceae bacterium]|nr:hypothetical protein [Lachnospiraceae bacterium]
MKKIEIREIEKQNLDEKYIWSNYMLQEEQAEKFYLLKYGGVKVVEIHCVFDNEATIAVEFRIYSFLGIKKVINEMFRKLKVENQQLRQIITYLMSLDNIGVILLKRIGFVLAVRLREIVRVRDKKQDILIFTFLYGE